MLCGTHAATQETGIMVDYFATAVVGIELDVAALTVKRRVGQHDFPENWQFHPATGKALWETIEGERVIRETVFPEGIEVFDAPDRAHHVIVGKSIGQCRDGGRDQRKSFTSAELTKAISGVRDALRPARLMPKDEDAVRLHILLKAS